MTPTAELQHSMTGRMRVRVPEKRGDRGYFDWVAGALRDVDGVENVETNPLTGSVLVLHRTDVATILHRAEQAELFHIPSPGFRNLPTAHVRDALTSADERIRSATRGGWDFNSVLMLACAVIGGVQVARHNVWPAAASMFWYALTLANEKNGVKRDAA